MSNYIQLAGLYEQLASKLSDLAITHYELDSTYEELDTLNQKLTNSENQNKLLLERCNTLEEQITTKNNVLHSKQNVIDILQNQINETLPFDSIELIYNDINIDILQEHINYLMLLEKESEPFVFEEIIANLNKLIELKKEYDKAQENIRNESDERLREF